MPPRKIAALDFWRNFDNDSGLEAPCLMRYLPPTFARFVAFDPRVPHMVQPVHAPRASPMEGRITLHGWLADPHVIWLGNDRQLELAESTEATNLLDSTLEGIMETLGVVILDGWWDISVSASKSMRMGR
jgi:hypothetical protein